MELLSSDHHIWSICVDSNVKADEISQCPIQGNRQTIQQWKEEVQTVKRVEEIEEERWLARHSRASLESGGVDAR